MAAPLRTTLSILAFGLDFQLFRTVTNVEFEEDWGLSVNWHVNCDVSESTFVQIFRRSKGYGRLPSKYANSFHFHLIPWRLGHKTVIIIIIMITALTRKVGAVGRGGGVEEWERVETGSAWPLGIVVGRRRQRARTDDAWGSGSVVVGLSELGRGEPRL